MKIGLIALDVDGTLVDDSHLRISERNKEALRECAARGIHIVLASGRPMSMMRPVAEELECVRYVISANGSAVWDLQNDRKIISREIPAGLSGQIMEILLDYPIALEVYSDGYACVNKGWHLENFDKMPAEYLEFRRAGNRFCDDLSRELAGKSVEKFNVDDMSQEILKEVLARLEPMKAQLAMQFIQCYDNLEINSQKATKGAALAKLCEQLEITPAQVMAFGDSDNDVTMLIFAGESFAMANGEAAAKKAAKYMAKANTEDGVAEMIETYVL
ncbi:MAG: Cof-type HAD-IIB family hydrolase [Eubacteriales bacterium]|nr:Cof-type HAD-IIB family hydrolase [Eubacteriales bacterium]